MANPYDGLVGMGYSGYAHIDNFPLLLLGSNPTEQDNLIKSGGAVSNRINIAVGELTARDRRVLQIQLNAQLNYTSAQLLGYCSFSWWALGLNGRSHCVAVYAANGNGYLSDEAYVDSVQLSVQENSLCTVQFSITAYKWRDVTGGSTPYQTFPQNLFANENTQPIPYWDCVVTHTGILGTHRQFTIGFSNNYQYQQLLESSQIPPNPRLIYPGPLQSTLQLLTIAQPGVLPAESGSAVIQLGGATLKPATPPITRIVIPFMYRDPTRAYQNVGEENGLISWVSDWRMLGETPKYL